MKRSPRPASFFWTDDDAPHDIEWLESVRPRPPMIRRHTPAGFFLTSPTARPKLESTSDE